MSEVPGQEGIGRFYRIARTPEEAHLVELAVEDLTHTDGLEVLSVDTLTLDDLTDNEHVAGFVLGLSKQTIYRDAQAGVPEEILPTTTGINRYSAERLVEALRAGGSVTEIISMGEGDVSELLGYYVLKHRAGETPEDSAE